MESYNNLVDAINALKQQGYTEDFNLQENCIECRNNEFRIFHDEFEIDKWFKIEGNDSSVDNASILYAISSSKYNLKGVMVNAYGIYSDGIANEMLEKLKFS